MRLHHLLILSALALANGGAGAADRAVALTGELLEIARKPACGLYFFGSAARYLVLSGPEDLVGKQFTAIIPCIELPGTSGNVRQFKVGAIHDSMLTRKAPKGILVDSSDKARPLFYLTSASSEDRNGSLPASVPKG